MTKEDIQRVMKPFNHSIDEGSIQTTSGNGPRSTRSFGEGFYK